MLVRIKNIGVRGVVALNQYRRTEEYTEHSN